MSVYEASITNPKKQLEFYKQLSEQLQQENQELKKQLENCYCNRTDCTGRIKDSKQYDSLVQRVENQQKEFIHYLTSYIELLSNKPDLIEESEIDLLKEILSKYQEIIGVSK